MSEKIQLTFEISESFLTSIADFLSRITVMAVKEKEEEKEEEEKEEEKNEETKEERTKEVSKEVSKEVVREEVVREEVKENNSFVSRVPCTGDVTGPDTGDVIGPDTGDKMVEYRVPSYSEVCDYVKRNNYISDPKKFFTYYEKTNWTTRYGERIRLWTVTIDAWERREKRHNPNALPFFRERQTTKDISDDLDSLMSRMERENKINDNAVCGTGN